MSDDQVAVILTKDVRDTRFDTEYLLVIGAEDGPSGLGMSVAAGVSAFTNPGVEEAFERADRTYDRQRTTTARSSRESIPKEYRVAAGDRPVTS